MWVSTKIKTFALGGAYDDIDDYSPVVSDIEEDQNEDETTPKQADNIDLLQQILNEQSGTKSELDDENIMDTDEPEEEG